jgi:hypothetical protein
VYSARLISAHARDRARTQTGDSVMATGLSQHASRLGHAYTQPSDERGSRAEQHTQATGSPFAIFSAFAGGLALVLSTGSLLASVAYLAHLIDTSWQLF